MGTKSIAVNIEEHFGSIQDPRIDCQKLHLLLDIIVIAILSWISAVSRLIRGRVIAIDGKVLHRSHERSITR